MRRVLLLGISVLAGALFGVLGLGAVAGTAAASTAEWGFIPRVVDKAGNGVAGVKVGVLDNGRRLAETTTDANGMGETLSVPKAGRYVLLFDTSGIQAGFVGGERYAVEKELGAAHTLPVQRILVGLDTPANGGEISKPTKPEPKERTFDSTILLRQLLSGLNLGLLLAIATIGLSLIYGTTRLTNFAQGESVTFGAMVAYVFCVGFGWPLVLAAAAAVVAGAAFGWVQDAGLWRPLRRRAVGLIPMMIASIGLGLAVRYLYFALFGSGSARVTPDTIPSVAVGPAMLPVSHLISMAISLAILISIGCWIKFSRIGRATRAISANSALAAASGVDVDRTIRLVWVLAGAMSALAGVLLALLNNVSYDMGFKALLLMFAAMILGGLGTAFGALVGSLVVGVFTEVLVTWLPSDLKYVGALVVLVIILLVRPQGIFGHRERVG